MYRISRICRIALRIPLLLIGILSLFTIANAQFGASVQGTVTDQNGAAVGNATVTLVNKETNKTQTQTSSDQGFYRFSDLAPGTYSVTAEAPNFKKKTIDPLAVQAEKTNGVNISLEAGNVSETITVTDAPDTATLDTATASIGKEITTDEVRRLPQVGRDPYELLRLTPGVFGEGARSGNGNSSPLPNTTGPGGSNSSIFQTENQVPISANGQRLSSNNFEIDGVSVNSLGFGGAAVVTPNQESVKEVHVQSAAYSAEYGRNSGAQIEVVSQNGTNLFHGSAVYKYQSPDLNAFNKFGGITGLATVNAPPVRVNNNFRQFAGSLGGAIIKDKLFFFLSYEGLRSRNTSSANVFVLAPQFLQAFQAARPNSLFTKVINTPGFQPRVIQVLPASCAGFAIANCKVVTGGINIGSFTGALGQYVSLGDPNGAGLTNIADLEFAQVALPSQVIGNQYNARIDFNPTSRDQISFSTYITKLNTLNSDASTGGSPLADLPFKPTNTAFTVAYIRTINSVLINEARGNFTGFRENQVVDGANVNFGIPRIQVEGLPIPNLEFGAPAGDTTPAIFAQFTYGFRDTLNWVKGNHGVKFGVEADREQNNNNLVGGARPLFSFSGLFNLANDTPIFEQINVDPRTGAPANVQRYFRTGDYAAFVQDDWKVKPNLTLNLGLRYEYFSPLHEKNGQLTNLVFTPGDLSTAHIIGASSLYDASKKNFGPRVGFAYSPKVFGEKYSDRLVVRGGFGIAYNRLPEVFLANAHLNPPFLSRLGLCCGTSPLDFGTPFANGTIQYVLGASNSPFSFPANLALATGINPANGGPNVGSAEVWATFPKLPNSYVYIYSLDTEYRLANNWIVNLGYQGSNGRKLIRLVNEIFVNPNAPGLNFGPIFVPTPDVNSSYNALNARLTRRFSQGLQFDAIYRFSKSIDELSYEGPGFSTNQTDPLVNATEKGPSDFDVKHYFVFSGLYDLPFLKNRSDFAGRALGGWQVNGIVTFHTGFPWTPLSGQSVSTPNGPSFGPTRPVIFNGGAGTSQSNSVFTQAGGNFPCTTAICMPNGQFAGLNGRQYFVPAPNGANFLTNGAPGIGRNSFRGPHYFDVDMTVGKVFGIPKTIGFLGEHPNLDIRANFFNVFNQLNLAPFGFFTPSTDINNPNFGKASAGLAGRVIEFQARFSF